jgi:hypothetical protein
MAKPATKAAKKKSPVRRQQIIVLVDGAGNYYELPRAALERSRVSEGRKEKVAAALEDVPGHFAHIAAPTIPGSIATAPFVGGRQLHYAGFYLSSTQSKR